MQLPIGTDPGNQEPLTRQVKYVPRKKRTPAHYLAVHQRMVPGRRVVYLATAGGMYHNSAVTAGDTAHVQDNIVLRKATNSVDPHPQRIAPPVGEVHQRVSPPGGR